MSNIDNTEYWNEFYKHNLISTPSTFFQFIVPLIQNSFIVLDIGCGSGRDSMAFAKIGNIVFAIDASEEVIQSNQKQNVHSNLKFDYLNICDTKRLKEFISSINEIRGTRSLLVYSRFFLHAIPEDIENTLLDSLQELLLEDDLIAFEFRTAEDEKLNKIYDNHYRRYIDTDEFNLKLTKYPKFKVEYFIKSQGLSVYKEEDPNLARYIIKKG